MYRGRTRGWCLGNAVSTPEQIRCSTFCWGVVRSEGAGEWARLPRTDDWPCYALVSRPELELRELSPGAPDTCGYNVGHSISTRTLPCGFDTKKPDSSLIYSPIMAHEINSNVQLLANLVDPDDEEDSEYRFLVDGKYIKYVTVAPGVLRKCDRTFSPALIPLLPPFP